MLHRLPSPCVIDTPDLVVEIVMVDWHVSRIGAGGKRVQVVLVPEPKKCHSHGGLMHTNLKMNAEGLARFPSIALAVKFASISLQLSYFGAGRMNSSMSKTNKYLNLRWLQ